jgi:putative transposase
MKEYQSLSHTRWDCKYHVVFAYSGERDRSFRPIVTAAHEMVLRG